MWEDSFQQKVNKIRGEEMGTIAQAQYIMAVCPLLAAALLAPRTSHPGLLY